MSGGHWGYMEHPIKEFASVWAVILEAVGDLEHIVDWSESNDTGRASYGEYRQRRFAEDVARALDNQEGKLPEMVLGEIAEARLRLDDYTSGREHERTRQETLRRVGRDIGPWDAKDERGAEAHAYDRLCVLFDAMQETGAFSWRR